ncbi:hypothetical protein BDV95DRAFT_592068 [Massariosphaeria phaeospora]|uniref:Asl1-like glycosyl hydrolase catalytic domain-containing protein n=1 Tax=Massariosphaeria phaeospora TaxID=100035 RepID=A0A7C8MH88_9PLEO|nr:hypothetical protein BDV95DRAFT_592068 [Massariosphaeria phaeospora]
MTKITLLLSALGLSTLSLVNAAPVARSNPTKRGLAYNDNGKDGFTSLYNAQQVSWKYNWGSATSVKGDGIKYVPLLHGNQDMHTKSWSADVDKAVAAGSSEVMSFNEPDQCDWKGIPTGGSCITDPAVAAAAHKQHVQSLLEKHSDLRIGAPAVTNGALSPVNTLMGSAYLKAFLAACDGCKIDFVVTHWYDAGDNVAWFKKHLLDVYEAGGKRPVWLTEFAATSGDNVKFLNDVLPWLDQQDWIERYAYHWLQKGSLVTGDGAALSPLGSAYGTIG